MNKPTEIVIVGGGTAGWMCAAGLAKLMKANICRVTLIESDDIGSVGVGEATLPQLKEFNDYIGIKEADMMQKTNGTFKLGIEFVDWGKTGTSYIHPFGAFGEKIGGVDFHQQWARACKAGGADSLEAYSYAVKACRENRFDFPVGDHSKINSTYSYAYHFDANLYSKYLRRFAEAEGLRRIEGKVVVVTQHPDSGNISTVTLESGLQISGDYFIDCSGFRSLLMGEALKAEFEDWSPWLLCDRAWAVPSERMDVISPYTRSVAKSAGWQWRIPLQHRTGNGYVFSSQFISEDEAASNLLRDIKSKPLTDPKLIKFKAGRYRHSWEKNCIAMGLASGFLEPLESTSIYLIQVAILQLVKMFPDKKTDQAIIDEFNRLVDLEYDRVRDFLILHYHLNQRDDAELWKYCRHMSVPESLTRKIEIFKSRGYIESYKYGLFAPPSWISVLVGQGVIQEGVEPYAYNLPYEQIRSKIDALASSIQDRVQLMPTHDEFLSDYCPAKVM